MRMIVHTVVYGIVSLIVVCREVVHAIKLIFGTIAQAPTTGRIIGSAVVTMKKSVAGEAQF